MRFPKFFFGLSALTLSVLSYTPLLPIGSELALAQSFESLPEFKFGSRTLQLGMAGTDVAELQRRLRLLGYFSGNITGIFDLATQTSIVDFQRDFSFDADGQANTQLQATLLGLEGWDGTWNNRLVGLRRNESGINVRQLQLLLQRAGFPPGTLDGRFGTNTENALIGFQRYYGLPGTGVVDWQTASYLVQINTAVQINSEQTGEESEFFSNEAENLYVVVIPQRNDALLLQKVRRVFPYAMLVETDRRGPYIEVGRFSSREFAEDRSSFAREREFDARVVYMRHQETFEDNSPRGRSIAPTWSPILVPYIPINY
ncbi:MAG: peptidoglycan-binding protein [Cyanobacteria bacterium J055]|nr:MAG: peptidoglycan-binding protein [Cyanobacteria bacterium J055]